MKDQEESQVQLELTQYKQRPYHRIQVKPEVWVASQSRSETPDQKKKNLHFSISLSHLYWTMIVSLLFSGISTIHSMITSWESEPSFVTRLLKGLHLASLLLSGQG